jgi:hypothetical protein
MGFRLIKNVRHVESINDVVPEHEWVWDGTRR